MKKGEKARVLIKFDYGYGEPGLPPRIPGKFFHTGSRHTGTIDA